MKNIKHVLIIYFYLSSLVFAQIISPERRIDWNPGIPGGIPIIISPIENVIDHSADPTGKKDSKSAFVSALDALPSSGGIVFIPAGSYKIESTIKINRDNIVFRGEGTSKTKLYIYSDGNCIEVVSSDVTFWQSLDSAYTKGTNQFTIADPSEFTSGLFAEIQQVNDPKIMYTKPEWEQPWSNNSVGQVFEIYEVEGKRIKVKTPLHFDLDSSLNPKIRSQKLVRNVGFEDFYIEKMIPKDHTFLFQNTAYCWMKNIESYHTRRSHVILSTCIGNEIRESYFHASFDYGNGGSGYGVECNHRSTDNLIENNIFDSLRHAMMVQVGANGNVFGYNYSANPVQGTGEINLNQDWLPPDISIHGHYPFMNLFESNCVEEIGISDYWGPVGPGNTYFRNVVNGEGIFYNDHSHKQNIIGNITTAIINSDSSSIDILEHGNVIGSEHIWSSIISNHTLPNSLYLKSKPEFLGKTIWPLFGPDVTTKSMLPAQIRIEENKQNQISSQMNDLELKSLYSPELIDTIIVSKYIQDSLKIDVSLPNGYSDNPEKKYQVIYLTDGYWRTEEHTTIHQMSDRGELPSVIIVGIGYPDSYDFTKIRRRDLVINSEKLFSSIQNEIIPYIESNFQGSSEKRTLWGSSLGGHFLVYAFSKHASAGEMFLNYICASPALNPAYKHSDLLKNINEFREINSDSPINLYITVGGSEEDFFIKSYNSIVNLIKSKNLMNLRFEYEVIPDTDHHTVWKPTLLKGLRMFLK